VPRRVINAVDPLEQFSSGRRPGDHRSGTEMSDWVSETTTSWHRAPSGIAVLAAATVDVDPATVNDQPASVKDEPRRVTPSR
jgi:hypothetical protein